MGHQIAFCCPVKLAESIQAEGFSVYITPESTLLGLPVWLSRFLAPGIMNKPVKFKKGKSIGNIWLVLILMGMISRRFSQTLVARELEAVREFQPDILFTELDPGAYIVSRISGIPLATTFASPAMEGVGSWAYRKVSSRINGILRKYNIEPVSLVDLCFGPQVLKILPTIPELDGTDPTKQDVRYVGYLLKKENRIKELPFAINKEKKYIFVYVGAGSVDFKTLETVLPEIFSKESEYICIVASEAVREPYSINSVHFYSYIPSSKLLPYCSWTICHGGHNTIMESIMQGVPLLIFPGAVFERRFNAHMVEQSGSGFMGESDEFTVSWIQDKMKHYNDLHQKCQELGKKIASSGGPGLAVKSMEEMVKRDK